jgi:branched-chain amino acid transport system permease protein
MSESTAHRSGPVWRLLRSDQLVRRPWLPVVVAIIAILLPELIGNAYDLRQVAFIAIYAMVVGGLNLSFGYAGELQFSQVFMFAVGAYAGVAFATYGVNDLILAMIVSAIAAAVVGALIAIPAIRIGGWALAMASFLLVVTIPEIVNLIPKYTGGLQGLTNVPLPEIFGRQLGFTGLYTVTIVAAVLWFIVFRNLVTSQYGLVFRVLRESPTLCQSLGFSVLRLKILAYIASAAPAGIAGCLFAFLSEIVDPNTFSIELAIGILAASILGGAESVYGAVVGAAILQLGPLSSLSFAQYADVAYGLFLILAAIAFRGGLSRTGKYLLTRFRMFVATAEPATSAALETDEFLSSASGPVVEPAQSPVSARRRRASGSASEQGVIQPGGLVVTGVSKAFGSVKALSEVSLAAPPGEITALIGANGSGKTTLLNVISGYVKADMGEASLDGEILTQFRPEEVARHGVRRTFQTPTIPHGASVLEVVASGQFAGSPVSVVSSSLRLPKYWRTQKLYRSEALEALDIVGLGDMADSEASSLPLGTRRLVEVARALAGRPRLLLLDEPASGLTELEVQKLGAVLETAAADGIAILLVEHNFEFVVSVSDTTYVLDLGRRIAAAPSAQIANDPAVVSSYLGMDFEPAAGTPAVRETRNDEEGAL